MFDRPRLLLLTPDYPPAKGGIHTLSARLAANIQQFQVKVVSGTARSAGPSEGVWSLPGWLTRLRPAVRNAFLNSFGMALGVRWRPDVVLSMHIVVAPAAMTMRRISGARYVQYVHAKELSVHPSLTRYALARADVVVAVSDFSRDLARRYGAREDRLRVICNGVDICPLGPTTKESCPTMITVARLEDVHKGHD
ncbi:MAG: glycosyltransferase, partial [Candidatus Dormibacteria bacterium]